MRPDQRLVNDIVETSIREYSSLDEAAYTALAIAEEFLDTMLDAHVSAKRYCESVEAQVALTNLASSRGDYRETAWRLTDCEVYLDDIRECQVQALTAYKDLKAYCAAIDTLAHKADHGETDGETAFRVDNAWRESSIVEMKSDRILESVDTFWDIAHLHTQTVAVIHSDTLSLDEAYRMQEDLDSMEGIHND